MSIVFASQLVEWEVNQDIRGYRFDYYHADLDLPSQLTVIAQTINQPATLTCRSISRGLATYWYVVAQLDLALRPSCYRGREGGINPCYLSLY
jgi:hypothetical protein